VLFVRRGGVTVEHRIDPDPLARLDLVDTRRVITGAVSAR
jgi:hypothetical protein